MRATWLLALLGVAAGGCTQEREADKALAALLARADEKCPGGTVKGCLQAAQEAAKRGEGARAAEMHERVCEAGAGSACLALAEALFNGRGVKRDEVQAAQRYQRGCELGEGRACVMLGSLYWQGRGVEADPAQAYAFYMRGCEKGDAAGCFSAAICHRTGACAEKSEDKATELLQRACKGGDSRACSTLGQR